MRDASTAATAVWGAPPFTSQGSLSLCTRPPISTSVLACCLQVGVEKPCPLIFEQACERLGLNPHEVVHLGDDRRNDLWGARDAGITAWLWGSDVHSFEEVRNACAWFLCMHGDD